MEDNANQVTPTSENNKSMAIWMLLGILILGGAAYALTRKKNASDNNMDTGAAGTYEENQAPTNGSPEDLSSSSTPESSMPSGTSSDTGTTAQGAEKVFNVTSSNFAFSMKEIKVNKGDKVKIVLSNTGGMHDWVVDEFNARTPVIQAGKTATVEFVADKTGTFEYYCSVGSHRQMGMKGNLIVQ